MTKKVLVVYASPSGSTAEVAEAIGKELIAGGATVDIVKLEDVSSLSGYDAVILGAPMIIGWHRGAMEFLEQHQADMSKIPVAYFITCLELARDADTVNSVPVYTTYGKPMSGLLKFKQKQTSITKYVEPILKQAPAVKPVSVAIFGGKLDYSTLNLFGMLFVRVIIRAKAGDYRDWDSIRSWASGLKSSLM
jgi:menaquinone-dependent protoporphyrinogen oxidase